MHNIIQVFDALVAFDNLFELLFHIFPLIAWLPHQVIQLTETKEEKIMLNEVHENEKYKCQHKLQQDERS